MALLGSVEQTEWQPVELREREFLDAAPGWYDVDNETETLPI